jgi:hypothetical protein
MMSGCSNEFANTVIINSPKDRILRSCIQFDLSFWNLALDQKLLNGSGARSVAPETAGSKRRSLVSQSHPVFAKFVPECKTTAPPHPLLTAHIDRVLLFTLTRSLKKLADSSFRSANELAPFLHEGRFKLL